MFDSAQAEPQRCDESGWMKGEAGQSEVTAWYCGGMKLEKKVRVEVARLGR